MSFFSGSARLGRGGWMTIFFCSFLLGIALLCLLPQILVWDTDFLARESFLKIQQLEINHSGLFVYTLQQRLKIILFLLFLSAAGAAGAACMLFWGWCGLSSGIVLTALSLRYGLKGLFLFCGCIFPQQLVLIPGFLFVMDWCLKKMQKRRLFLSVLVVITGCFLESYVNPTVLKVVLRIFPI